MPSDQDTNATSSQAGGAHASGQGLVTQRRRLVTVAGVIVLGMLFAYIVLNFVGHAFAMRKALQFPD